MAKEIQFTTDTGVTAYANLTNSVGQWYNTATPGFEAFNAANVTDYDIAATEFGTSGVYSADMPGVAAGFYNVVARRRIGGSPALTDTVVGDGEILWDGSAVLSAAGAAAAMLDLADAVETNVTVRKALRLMAAVLGGKSANSGADFRNIGDSKTVVDSTLDGSGNRTAVTLDLT